jgi:carbonic anhydrase
MTKLYFKTLVLLVSSQFIFSCAYLQSEDDGPSEAQKETSTKMAAPVKIVEAPALKNENVVIAVSENVKLAHQTVQAQLGPADDQRQGTPTTHLSTGLEPSVALGWLKNGNTRFLKKRFRTDGQSSNDVKRLSKAQHPHTVVIACSDSRVPPEILFDQKLGEIFVIRTAGEALDSMSVASLEYALSHLGTRHVLVLGHTHCGAVKAACATLESGDAGSESLNALVRDIHPRLQDFRGKPNSPGFVNEVWANTKGVAEDLAKRSGIVAFMLKNKKIQITTAVYDIEKGSVEFK